MPEKVFADILDKDNVVKKWLRNPDNGLRIKCKYGNYYPDFIVETAKENYVIEIKMKKEIDEEGETVFEKAKEGLCWCEKLSNATGKKWSYKLIPHDKIRKTDTFKGNYKQCY